MKRLLSLILIPHLVEMKFAFCVEKKRKRGVVIPPLLDARLFDVQTSYLKLMMNHNAKGMMHEH
jgi:hypothetical protein